MSRSSLAHAAEIHLWTPGVTAFGGGIGAFNRELASALAVGWPVQLVGKSDLGGTWRGLPLRGSGHTSSRIRTAHFAASLAALAITRRPRLIVSAHINFGPVARALRYAFGPRYVLVAYGIEIGERLATSRLRALRAADSVWSISRWTSERLLAAGVAEARIRQIPVTVADDRFTIGGATADLRARLGIADTEKVVLTVSRLDASERYKGCDTMLAALPTVSRAVGRVRYLVVGGGDDLARLKGVATNLGIQDQVTFCGFVPDADLPSYYRLADAFAMPSTGEGFGIVFLEAMVSGIPVLGGNWDGSADALGDGKLGLLVDPTSVDAVAGGIIRLLLRQGPPLWFDPLRLRNRCIELFGREAFGRRVRDAVHALESGAIRR